MHITTLRKVGRSVMLAVPPVFLDQLHLKVGSRVSLAIEDGRLVVSSKPRPRYSMAELLAASDYSKPQSVENREWVNGPAVGGELNDI
ncbi:AbrB/MazE/SpoVT family DNA-binding domain-containing protein [Pseudomonas sp. 3A(2025)]